MENVCENLSMNFMRIARGIWENFEENMYKFWVNFGNIRYFSDDFEDENLEVINFLENFVVYFREFQRNYLQELYEKFEEI